MPRPFDVPAYYRSEQLVTIKRARREADPRKRDLAPSLLRYGGLNVKIARHFGFCYGVENAIEIAYRALRENPGKRIFLLSEMIHNPDVNHDLLSRGVRFLMSTRGERLLDFAELSGDDIVIVPAFGTTLELEQELREQGVDPSFYDATCPFVQKVWKRASELGRGGFTVIIHGKHTHEETRATFSHSCRTAPTLVILDRADAEAVAEFIRGRLAVPELIARFGGNMSDGFDPERDLQRLGVVNQTTMLATETQDISGTIRAALVDAYGAENIADHFADTRDTLCYATYENQSATTALIDAGADLALVVGGYNSSNTSHLVEIAEERVPTFYIRNAAELFSPDEIRHYDIRERTTRTTFNWLPAKRPLEVALTSGASCPDQVVEEVIERLVRLVGASPQPLASAFLQA